MRPSFEERRRMIQDQMAELQYRLEQEGFSRVVPRAEYFNLISTLCIFRTDGSIDNIPSSRVKEILAGEFAVPAEDLRLIADWYDTSYFRFYWEVDKLSREVESASRAGETRRAQDLNARIAELQEKALMTDGTDERKRELGRVYGESGDRLERLYSLYNMIERRDTKTVQVGSFTASISAQQFTSAPVPPDDGFFAQLRATYDMVKSAKGNPEFSTSTGIVYTDEFALAKGAGQIPIRGSPVSLEATIHKDGVHNILSCVVETERLGADIKHIIKRTELVLTDYSGAVPEALDKTTFVARREEVQFCYDGAFRFYGEPPVLQREIPKVLEKLWHKEW